MGNFLRRITKCCFTMYVGGCLAASWTALIYPEGIFSPLLWPFYIGDFWYNNLM